MKHFRFLCIIAVLCTSGFVQAQALNLSISSGTRYVYFPNQEMYYDANQKQYISFDINLNKWVHVTVAPTISVDLYQEPKVELDYTSDNPEIKHSDWKKKYPPSQMKKMDPNYHPSQNGNGHGNGNGNNKPK